MKLRIKNPALLSPLPALIAAAALFGSGGPPPKPITFDHGFHVVDVGLSCDVCHAAIETAVSGARSMPGHRTCADCHDVETMGQCSACHPDPAAPVPIPPVTGRYEGFAHNTHHAAGVECRDCHGKIDKTGDRPILPGMSDCQGCHLERSGTLECVRCHLGQRPLPGDHRLATWRDDHGLEAAFASSDCASCHAQYSCDECHQGVNIYGSPHPPSWKFDHFAAASFGSECLSCHETRQTCTACHRALLPIPHELGPVWANDIDGGEHCTEAEAFTEVCLSCHDLGEAEPTCARCHD